MHKKLSLLLLFCAFSVIHVMDVDTEPVSRKKKHAPSNESIQPISSNASSVLTDIFILSETQKESFEKVVHNTTNKNDPYCIACMIALQLNGKISKSDLSENRFERMLDDLKKLTIASDPNQVPKQHRTKQKHQ